MKNYKIKLDGSADAFQELSTEQISAMERKTEKVSIKVSKRMLRRMKDIAGIQGEVSDSRIVYAYIKTTLTNLHP